ncbi:MAG: glucose-6-phosphate isomerase [Stappiaceae bacterium]
MNRPKSDVWQQLSDHRRTLETTDLRQMFASDPDRFDTLSVSFEDMLLDLSKNRLTAETLNLLSTLATDCGLEKKRDAMFSGQAINSTEGRAVLHTALRNQSGSPVLVDGEDVMGDVQDVLSRMADFSGGVRSGSISAHDGAPFSDVVNIGIGGSDLGPVMTTLALAPYHDGPRLHYISNIDGAHIADTLKRLDPARTLFLIASKTFTTIETMTNAQTARKWIADALGEDAVGAHFAAISTALEKVSAFGIDSQRVFGFWDWVGGRYSIWSAIGLPLMIAIGADNFDRFLAGGHAMDKHFQEAPLLENLPVLLGLTGVWYRDIWQFGTRAVLPYDQRLARLPAYLQQLDMESNGKQTTLAGEPVEQETGPIVWGEAGTNGQHAFYQLIHQGTSVIPVEFLIAAKGHEPELTHHHDLLVANCLAQSEALMMGRTLDEVCAILERSGMSADKVARLAPHKVFPGNRPSTTIAYDRLDPYTLGRLISLYEHRVFVEGAIWDINSFDQWGVELGKELATELLPMVNGESPSEGKDSSTLGLLAKLRH